MNGCAYSGEWGQNSKLLTGRCDVPAGKFCCFGHIMRLF